MLGVYAGQGASEVHALSSGQDGSGKGSVPSGWVGSPRDAAATASLGGRVDGLSDVELLLSALAEAVDAKEAGVLMAPFGVDGVDEVALRRAERAARRSDAAREAVEEVAV